MKITRYFSEVWVWKTCPASTVVWLKWARWLATLKGVHRFEKVMMLMMNRIIMLIILMMMAMVVANWSSELPISNIFSAVGYPLDGRLFRRWSPIHNALGVDQHSQRSISFSKFVFFSAGSQHTSKSLCSPTSESALWALYRSPCRRWSPWWRRSGYQEPERLPRGI